LALLAVAPSGKAPQVLSRLVVGIHPPHHPLPPWAWKRATADGDGGQCQTPNCCLQQRNRERGRGRVSAINTGVSCRILNSAHSCCLPCAETETVVWLPNVICWLAESEMEPQVSLHCGPRGAVTHTLGTVYASSPICHNFTSNCWHSVVRDVVHVCK
jgi:hypothetical protein